MENASSSHVPYPNDEQQLEQLLNIEDTPSQSAHSTIFPLDSSTSAAAAVIEPRENFAIETAHGTTTVTGSLDKQQRLLAVQLELLDQQDLHLKQKRSVIAQEMAKIAQQRAAAPQVTASSIDEAARVEVSREQQPMNEAVGPVLVSLPQQPPAAAAPLPAAKWQAKKFNNTRAGTTTISMEELKRHMARAPQFWNKSTHSMKCPVCNKQRTFWSLNDVRDHLATHLCEADSIHFPYKCPMKDCDYRALRKNEIKNHLARNIHRVPWTPEMKLQCADEEKKRRFDALLHLHARR